jgi:plasmid stabilization system protein ParE
MPYDVRLSRAVIRELETIKAYYTQVGAGRTAARKYAAILISLRSLEVSPTMYPDDPDAPGFKAIPVSGHWVRFRIHGQAVTVARIFWPQQNRT